MNQEREIYIYMYYTYRWIYIYTLLLKGKKDTVSYCGYGLHRELLKHLPIFKLQSLGNAFVEAMPWPHSGVFGSVWQISGVAAARLFLFDRLLGTAVHSEKAFLKGRRRKY